MKHEVKILAIAAMAVITVGLGGCSSVESDRLLAQEPQAKSTDSPDRAPGLFGPIDDRG